ncbi:hypothetical protein DPEC_G00198610 [Dallia pectoralis]|uniref:Uncharacterized protein n=1 Tax=Dallia pectoralis TaxID=75939 RepID=A0ACC2G8Q3_DALPE|nr:hypothetical protein DPEC_G00198610 [Dallia pectoralis]
MYAEDILVNLLLDRRPHLSITIDSFTNGVGGHILTAKPRLTAVNTCHGYQDDHVQHLHISHGQRRTRDLPDCFHCTAGEQNKFFTALRVTATVGIALVLQMIARADFGN